MKTLSVCMIVKNEAKNIRAVIKNVGAVADEIIIVDTGSTDGTQDIIIDCGLSVYNFKWNTNFSAARNESLKYATCDWIMWVDADDFIPVESIEEINRLKQVDDKNFFIFTIKNINPQNSDFIGGNEFFQNRMFPNGLNIKFEGRLHEQFTKSAESNGLTRKFTDIIIEHHGYQNPQTVAQKLKRNISIMLIDMGFPEDTVFSMFEIMGYNCFYAPNVLTIWDNNIFIGGCNPFEHELPDNKQKQNEILLQRALEIVQFYDKKKKEQKILNDENIISFESEISRMEREIANIPDLKLQEAL
jgi:glycosyltransferase involved in cell wall biosynthesis